MSRLLQSLSISSTFLFTLALSIGSLSDAAIPEGKAGAANKSDSPPAKLKITSTSASVREAAKQIDDLVAKGYEQSKLSPTRVVNDEEFLRRVYLDLNGAIPTLAQAKAFLDSRDPAKRQKLIDELLDSPGYISHTYNYWADLLRISNRTRGDVAGNFPKWIKQSIAQNKPFDQFVREMITAQGKAHENGAVGYWLRDDGMVLEITATTAQVFLGTQIGCAQCHDHPFDNWDMKQFYELAAFTSEVVTRDRNYRSKEINEVRRKAQSGDLPREVQQVLQNMLREASYGVSDQPRKTLKLPNDYQYDNGKPGQVVSAHVIFGEAPASRDLSSRERYAQWLTSPSNPLFTKVIANRLWARVMGIGLVNPIDDFSELNTPTNPQLLDHLAKLMTELKYDTKEYLRIVLNSKTYQLATNREDYNKDNHRNQAGVLRRMTAEQLWDSFITMTVENANAGIGDEADDEDGDSMMMAGGGAMMMAAATDVDLTKMKADQIIAYAEKIVADRKAARNRPAVRRQQQARVNPNMLRASETRQPAPAGHFLREFGGSARETVADAHTDPSVPQVLFLLNGSAFTQLTGRTSELAKNVTKASTDKEKVEVLYLSILSRYPSPTEAAIAMREIKTNGLKGIENLTWALINTREFLFIR